MTQRRRIKVRRKGEKKPKTKKSPPSPLDDAVRRYREASEFLAQWRSDHEEAIDAYEAAAEEVKEARKSLETLALERSKSTEKGKHVIHEDDRYVVRHKIGARRQVDAALLLKKYPKLRGWDGLFSVVVGKFDAAVEAGQIGGKDAGALVTENPTNSVEIVEKQHGESN